MAAMISTFAMTSWNGNDFRTIGPLGNLWLLGNSLHKKASNRSFGVCFVGLHKTLNKQPAFQGWSSCDVPAKLVLRMSHWVHQIEYLTRQWLVFCVYDVLEVYSHVLFWQSNSFSPWCRVLSDWVLPVNELVDAAKGISHWKYIIYIKTVDKGPEKKWLIIFTITQIDQIMYPYPNLGPVI